MLILAATTIIDNGPTLAVALASALLGGGLVRIFKARTDKRATILTSTTEAADSIARASASLIQPLQQELTTTRDRVTSLEAELAAVREHLVENGVLMGENASLKQTIQTQRDEIITLTRTLAERGGRS